MWLSTSGTQSDSSQLHHPHVEVLVLVVLANAKHNLIKMLHAVRNVGRKALRCSALASEKNLKNLSTLVNKVSVKINENFKTMAAGFYKTVGIGIVIPYIEASVPKSAMAQFSLLRFRTAARTKIC